MVNTITTLIYQFQIFGVVVKGNSSWDSQMVERSNIHCIHKYKPHQWGYEGAVSHPDYLIIQIISSSSLVTTQDISHHPSTLIHGAGGRSFLLDLCCVCWTSSFQPSTQWWNSIRGSISYNDWRLLKNGLRKTDAERLLLIICLVFTHWPETLWDRLKK